MLSVIPLFFLVYTGIGLVVALAFVCVGVGRVDVVAKGSSVVFRVFILPGCVGLWPVVLLKWWHAGKAKQVGQRMSSAQLKMHAVMWLVFGLIALAGLVLAVVLKPAEPVHEGVLPGAVGLDEFNDGIRSRDAKALDNADPDGVSP